MKHNAAALATHERSAVLSSGYDAYGLHVSKFCQLYSCNEDVCVSMRISPYLYICLSDAGSRYAPHCVASGGTVYCSFCWHRISFFVLVPYVVPSNDHMSAVCFGGHALQWSMWASKILAVRFAFLTLPPLSLQIMKSDEDVRMISAEAPVLFARVPPPPLRHHHPDTTTPLFSCLFVWCQQQQLRS